MMKLSALALATGLAFTSSAFAAQAVWDTAAPWGDISNTSQYAEWGSFYDPASEDTGIFLTDSNPDIGLSSGTSASISESSQSAFVTSGGNIYSFSLPMAFTATLSGTTGGLFDVYLRIATLGTISSTSALLNGVSATSTIQFSRSAGTMMGGASTEQEVYWLWKDVAGADLYTFNFNATSSSMSLDQLALATVAVAAVPEPSTYGMLALGLGVLAYAGRRTRKNQA
ncbi:PEP-CTERM sorting domain-containing protein [Methylobacillus methanolivorans]|uniref:PEP-CTERM sorting domain-containing protein n=1 Tax=Methylobacillus methanolivorans TaxID=1848927 RepID=A0ABW8GJ68_9PROT